MLGFLNQFLPSSVCETQVRVHVLYVRKSARHHRHPVPSQTTQRRQLLPRQPRHCRPVCRNILRHTQLVSLHLAVLAHRQGTRSRYQIKSNHFIEANVEKCNNNG